MSDPEVVAAARALLPGGSWAPYAVSAVPFFGGLAAGICGERRAWLVGGLWGAAMAGCWAAFNPLGLVQWAIGGTALALAGWASARRPTLRRHWLLGPPLLLALGLCVREVPAVALASGVAGSSTLVEYALERAAAGEVDEAIVFGEAAASVASPEEQASAALVLASLYAAEGNCEVAVVRARVAHAALGSDLPKMDEAVAGCFRARGP